MASVPQLSTLQKSAAERPQLEVAQQQMQARVSSLESQFEAASAGAKQVRHLNSGTARGSYSRSATVVTQAMANMDDAIKQSQLKDSELTELQKNVAGALSAFIHISSVLRCEKRRTRRAGTLQDIEKIRASFRDETARLGEELKTQTELKKKLETQSTELQERHQEKEAGLSSLLSNHESDRERNQQSFDRVRADRRPVHLPVAA